MTEKQEKIIWSALELFAEFGFDATSTSKVAKKAGVSEGLIFRHFENKEGLLMAIMNQGIERATGYFNEIIKINDPAERIKQALSLPFLIDESENRFWKLIYALKWQRGSYDDSMADELKKSLAEAFNALGYDHPYAEAELVQVFIDGVATEALLKGKASEQLLEIILNKYRLT